MKEKIIYLPENVNNLWIYEELLPDLNQYYNRNRRDEIIKLSFEKVKWLDSLSLPNIMIIGTILKLFHKKAIPILFQYDMRLINFLRCSDFFNISNLSFLNIFEYNEEFVNQASFFAKKEYRDKHKIHYYTPDLSYYDIDSEEEEQIARSEMYQSIRYGIVPNDYREVINDKNIFSSDEVDILLDIFSELICNSILYSKSISYSFLQTSKYNSSISISDAGIGFKNSLKKKKNFKYYILDKYKDKFNLNIFEDFLFIIESLNYSMNQKRRNLWQLKNIIVNNGGILRIHYNSTQIIFNSTRCSGCEKSAEDCIQCFIERFYKNYKVSALRVFPSNLKGVHIEVEIGSGGNGVKC